MMKEFDVVKLKEDFQGINAGTEGTIVLECDGTAFEVEFVDGNLDTVAVIITSANLLELVQSYN